MVAEDLDRGLELNGQAFLVNFQFAQAHQNIGGAVVAGDLGELQAAEQQVVGVGGHALQLQPPSIVNTIELGLDIVFSGRQKRQRVAQHRIVGFEPVYQPRLFLDGGFIR